MVKIKLAGKLLCILAMSVFLAAGCKTAQVKAEPVAEMDNPLHHYKLGLKKIDEGKLDDALTEFKRATSLEPDYPLSHTGTAIVYAKQGKYVPALELAEKGVALSKGKKEESDARIGLLRVYAETGTEEWLKKSEKEFDYAVRLMPQKSCSYYFMGNAYKKALDFGNADRMYRVVLGFNREYVKEADENLVVIQKIVRAAPGTEFGRKIALLTGITRADVAALFVTELGLEKLLFRKTVNREEPSFKTPEQYKKNAEDPKLPEDVETHPLKLDIEAALKYAIRGLEVTPAGKFNPDKLITKADYALMLEDLISRIEEDKTLSGKFLDNNSPYADLRSDNYAFNSIMVCVSKNIIDPDNEREFGVTSNVSGADALLALRKLKEELKLRQAIL